MGAKLRPELQPAVKGGAEEGKSGFRHVLMLEGEILADDRELSGQPVLEIGRGFENIHAEPLGISFRLNMSVFDSGWAAAQARLVNREFRGTFGDLLPHALFDLGVG